MTLKKKHTQGIRTHHFTPETKAEAWRFFSEEELTAFELFGVWCERT